MRKDDGATSSVGQNSLWYHSVSPRSQKPSGQKPSRAMIENCFSVLPGRAGAQSSRYWDVNGAGHPSVQGFSTAASVEPRQQLGFKVRIRRALDPGRWHGGGEPSGGSGMHSAGQIQVPFPNLRLSSLFVGQPRLRMDVYRLGYYGGAGARLMASHWATVEQIRQAETQPTCRRDNTTLLVDCGNWIPTFRWRVPAHATSGLYFARFVRSPALPRAQGTTEGHVTRDSAEGSISEAGERERKGQGKGDGADIAQADALRTWRVDAAAGPLNPQFANVHWDYSAVPPCGETPTVNCLLRGLRNAGGARDAALRGRIPLNGDGRGPQEGRNHLSGISAESLVEPVASHAYFVVREPEPEPLLGAGTYSSPRSGHTGHKQPAQRERGEKEEGSNDERVQHDSDEHAAVLLAGASRPSSIIAQVSDVTWRAYNYYGGPNVYGMRPHERHRWDTTAAGNSAPECAAGTGAGTTTNAADATRGGATQGKSFPQGAQLPNLTDCLPPAFTDSSRRAFKTSLNTPLTVRDSRGVNAPLGADYPAIRWLEREGYAVAYWSGVDTHCRGRRLLPFRPSPRQASGIDANDDKGAKTSSQDRSPGLSLSPSSYHVFISLGHDEYWSERQRRWVEQARDGAGTGLQFWSGNEMYWRIRWEEGLGGAYRSAREGCLSMDVRDGPRFMCPCESGVSPQSVVGSTQLLDMQSTYSDFGRSMGQGGLSSGSMNESSMRVEEALRSIEWRHACAMQGMQPPAPDDLAAHQGSNNSYNHPSQQWYNNRAFIGDAFEQRDEVRHAEAICNPRTIVVFKETAASLRLDEVEPSTIIAANAWRGSNASLPSRKLPRPGHSIWHHHGWTGTFRDDSAHRHSRRRPAASGDLDTQGLVWMKGAPARPEQSVTGQSWRVNAYRNDHLELPAQESQLQFWQDTPARQLLTEECGSGSYRGDAEEGESRQLCDASAVLKKGLLGHEWDVDEDRVARPAGIARLSRTTVHSVLALVDNGATFDTQSATHRLTAYRVPGPPHVCSSLSTDDFGRDMDWARMCRTTEAIDGRSLSIDGAIVFGAGTVQYSWGLDPVHDRPTGAPTFAESDVNARVGVDQEGADPSVQQLTRRLLAMQGEDGDHGSLQSQSDQMEARDILRARSAHPTSRVIGVLALVGSRTRLDLDLQQRLAQCAHPADDTEAMQPPQSSEQNSRFIGKLWMDARRSTLRLLVLIEATVPTPRGTDNGTQAKGGALVAGVDVSIDDGKRWHPTDRVQHVLEDATTGSDTRAVICEALRSHLPGNADSEGRNASRRSRETLCPPDEVQIESARIPGRNLGYIPRTYWMLKSIEEGPSRDSPSNMEWVRGDFNLDGFDTESIWVAELTLAELAADAVEMPDLERRWKRAMSMAAGQPRAEAKHGGVPHLAVALRGLLELDSACEDERADLNREGIHHAYDGRRLSPLSVDSRAVTDWLVRE